jgi:TolB-like protein
VCAEATIADRNKTLLPVTIEACNRPVMFELTQTGDLSNWRGESTDKNWLAFLEDLHRMVGRDPHGTAKAVPASEELSTRGGMPIVAVLPIAHRSVDEETQYLAEDLTEDITRELGRCPYFKVISGSTMAAWRSRSGEHANLTRELGACYLVESKLQAFGDDLRLTVELVDTTMDSMLLSTRFVRKIHEVRAAPEQLPLSVVGELIPTIGQFEMNEALAKQGPYTAWERMLRAWAFQTRSGQGTERAVEEARFAISAAPDYGLAYATLAFALTGRLLSERLSLGDAERRELVLEAQAASKRAIDLDGHNPAVLTRLAQVYATMGDPEAGLRLAQRASRLSPSSVESQYALGYANFMMGRAVEAVEAFSKPDCIAWSDVSRLGQYTLLGICLFIESRTREAEAKLDESLAMQPNSYLALRWKAVVAAELGKEKSAKAAIRRIHETEPDKSIDDYLDSMKHLPIEHPRKYEAIEILRRLLLKEGEEAT